MKIVFLGTNGWYDNKTGNTICTLIETKNNYIIFDAGNGIYKLDQYISKEKPIHIFLSHFHLDHIEGLHILSKFNFKQVIHIYGQLNTVKILNTIINTPFTASLKELNLNIQIHELAEGKHHIENNQSTKDFAGKSPKEGFNVECKFLSHSSPCLGYRIVINEKTITYCTDTGICPELLELAKDSDLFITECSLKIGQKNENWPHLNPEDAVKIAQKAGASKLILTHFDANNYKMLEDRLEIRKKMKNIFKNIIIAYDDMEMKL